MLKKDGNNIYHWLEKKDIRCMMQLKVMVLKTLSWIF